MGFTFYYIYDYFKLRQCFFIIFTSNIKLQIVKSILPLISVIILLSSSNLNAQNDQALLINDMLLVAENFASPGAEGAALQGSAGWFSSASTLDKWKFEVSIHGNALFVPSAKQKKLSNNADFSILRFQGSNNALLPTVYGGTTDVVFTGQIFDQNFSFNAISGLGKETIIHPHPQVRIGLPYSTEVAVRYLPSVVVDDVGFSTFGLGIKHNFTQYYEQRYDPENFQFAAGITYSNFKVDYQFNQISIPGFVELNRIDVDADLWLFQILGSKLYSSFEVFGALGLTSSNFDYELGGTGSALPLLNGALANIEGSGNKFKGDVGFNYYFSNFKISTMFTASNFFNANLGIHYRI